MFVFIGNKFQSGSAFLLDASIATDVRIKFFRASVALFSDKFVVHNFQKLLKIV